MSRQSKDHAFWAGEWAYIASVDPGRPGKEFNHRPDVFADYCAMQARFAEGDGFPVVARDMRTVETLAREYADAQTLQAMGVDEVRAVMNRVLHDLDDLSARRVRGLLETVLGPDASNHRRAVAENALGGLVVRNARILVRELLKGEELG